MSATQIPASVGVSNSFDLSPGARRTLRRARQTPHGPIRAAKAVESSLELDVADTVPIHVWVPINGSPFTREWWIEIWHEEDGIVVSDDVVHRAGYGATLPDALTDYVNWLFEYRDLLREDAPRSPDLEQHLSVLNDLLEERPR